MLRDFNAQHTDVYRLGLQEEYVKTPDYLCQAMDAFARTTQTAQGAAIAIPALLDFNDAYFYADLDRRPTVDKNEEVATYYAEWHYMQTEVGLAETKLKQNLGLTLDAYFRNDPPIGINAATPKTIMSLFGTTYKSGVIGGQKRRVDAFYGTGGDVYQDLHRAPESIEDLFSRTGPWHGIGVDALETWDRTHPWYHNPPSNYGNSTDPTDEMRYRHRAQFVDLTGAASARKLGLRLLNRILGPFQEVVQTPCLGAIPSDDFYALTEDIMEHNTAIMPQGAMRGAMGEYLMWLFDVQAIKIHNTWFIPSLRMPENTIRIFNVGNPGQNDGTFYPIYSAWDAPVGGFGEIARTNMNDLPQALNRFAPVQIPWDVTEWRRAEAHSQAMIADVKLDTTYVCDMRPYQMQITGYDVPAIGAN